VAIDSFIKKFQPYADKIAAQTGINAESILAQAGLETGWNEAPKGWNFFGIKTGKSWTGAKMLLRTKEVLSNGTTTFPKVYSVTKRSDGKFLYDVEDWFRSYASPGDSFADWAKLVQSRFPAAWAVRSDKAKFAAALASGGYATADNYAGLLVDVLRSVEKRIGKPLTAVAEAVKGKALPLVAILAAGGVLALFLLSDPSDLPAQTARR
jgi:flagellum-specific peptidoglycan hydrolase FlgJ